LPSGNLREQPRYDYLSLGIGRDDVAELARMAADDALWWADSGER
jgi:hypothetical protein